MASQRMQRYIAVQQAKGAQPDPLTLAKMLREDVSGGQAYRSPVSKSVKANPTSTVRDTRKRLVKEKQVSGISGDVSGDPGEAASLSSMIGADIASSSNLGKKGAIKGGMNLAANLALNPNPTVASHAASLAAAFTAPVSIVAALNTIAGSTIQGGMIAHSLTTSFGEEATQEAADVMSGISSLSAISSKGQTAYANAKIAAENAPKSLIAWGINTIKGKTAPPLTSLVTPHHTNEAISEAFGVDAIDTSAVGGTLQGITGSPSPVDTSGIGGSLPGSIDSSGLGGTLHGSGRGGGGGSSGGNVGAGGQGPPGIGPGQR